MSETEDRIRDMVLSSLGGPIHTGLIKCDASSGYMAMTGSLQRSESAETTDFLSLLPQDYDNPERDFTSLVERLHKESLGNSDLPSWYRCNIQIRGSDCTFRFWREDEAVTDLSVLEPTIDGSTPTFPFRNKFPLALLQQLREAEYHDAFLTFAPLAMLEQRQISGTFLGYFALIDWQADTNNGSLDQYFARPTDWLGAEVERARLYPEVRSSLRRLDLPAALDLFEEAIGLYSHFHQRVDEARAAMGIAAVPKQTQSDIMGRYYDMLDEIERRQWEYFGQHLHEFAVG